MTLRHSCRNPVRSTDIIAPVRSSASFAETFILKDATVTDILDCMFRIEIVILPIVSVVWPHHH
jgi:hypothetical protein